MSEATETTKPQWRRGRDRPCKKNRDPRTNANPCSNTATMRRFGYSHSIVAGGFEEMS